jgi:tRNA threonylcarbamoyladenosine biosynthesis protein TsaB
MEGYLLAMDTSTRGLTVALLRDHECIVEQSMEAERNHSIYLVPIIQQMLANEGVTVHDLRAVAVGQGPGSYTGVRIGVTVAKTLAWSLKIPLIGISSLEAYAHAARAQVQEEDCLIVPMLDARRGQIYSARFSDQRGVWQRLADDQIVDATTWLHETATQIGAQSTTSLVLHGDLESFTSVLTELRHLLGERMQTLTIPLSAYHIGLLARLRWLRGEVDDLHSLVPNYTQLAEAEAKLRANKALGGTTDGTTGDVS